MVLHLLKELKVSILNPYSRRWDLKGDETRIFVNNSKSVSLIDSIILNFNPFKVSQCPPYFNLAIRKIHSCYKSNVTWLGLTYGNLKNYRFVYVLKINILEIV